MQEYKTTQAIFRFLLSLPKHLSRIIMKNQLINLSLVLAAWALGVNAASTSQITEASVEDVCSLLTSLSTEAQMVNTVPIIVTLMSFHNKLYS